MKVPVKKAVDKGPGEAVVGKSSKELITGRRARS
jgi:hypothetical protein